LFVRVNQVLVRLWARRLAVSDRGEMVPSCGPRGGQRRGAAG
jgi:hypothetical protein